VTKEDSRRWRPKRSKSPKIASAADLDRHGLKVSHKEIYRRFAAHYELLVSRQDYLLNIPKSLRSLDVFHAEADVIELGAGTGRLTRMVAPWVRSIHAFDTSEHMITLARERMPTDGEVAKANWKFDVGNNREVHAFGLQPACADVVLAGTAFRLPSPSPPSLSLFLFVLFV
jgi:ubiquinone/menaquinone biosynthesis C-methylase UbiE